MAPEFLQGRICYTHTHYMLDVENEMLQPTEWNIDFKAKKNLLD